jgi:hypothetical protein
MTTATTNKPAKKTRSRKSAKDKAAEAAPAPRPYADIAAELIAVDSDAAPDSTPEPAPSAEGNGASEDNAAKEESYQQRMRKLPMHLQIEAKVRAADDRTSKLLDLVDGWVKHYGDEVPEELAAMQEAGNAASAAMKAFAKSCSDMPSDWKPPTKKRQRKEIAVGSKVDIREKYLDKYNGHLDDEDLKGLTVTGSASGSVWLSLNSDPAKEINVTRGHIVMAAAD